MEGWQRIDVGGRLIAFTIVLAIGTAVLFGIMPAIRASRPRLTETLKDGGRGASAGRQRQRLRHALVIAEIALALPLLVASGMTTLGSYRFLYGSQGYEPAGLLTTRASLPDASYLEPERRRRFAADLTAQLSALPVSEPSPSPTCCHQTETTPAVRLNSKAHRSRIRRIRRWSTTAWSAHRIWRRWASRS